MITLLGKRADVFPFRLWCWCAKFARKGFIDDAASQIEKACGWDGKPGVLHAAFVEAKVLEKDGKTVHDWFEHAGRFIKAYEDKKKKQKKKYAKQSEATAEECRNSAGILPEENGILPPIREEKRIEEKRITEQTASPESVSELSPEWLARIWVDQCQAKINRSKRDKVEDVSVQFAEWIRSKIPASEIAAEMEKPDRDRTELLWQFKKRLVERLASRPNKDDFNARLLEEMRKEGHVK